jgi:NAD(P)-dependent dehydrogenase (short-subunit alcohol dehydrogenase family)
MNKPKNCLLTGAAMGLGQSLAAAYQAQQWQVYGVDCQQPEHSHLHTFMQCDLAQSSAVEQLCAQLNGLPSLHTVILNAAAYHFTPFIKVTAVQAQQIMQVNTFSHMQMLQALLTSHHQDSLKHVIVIGSDQVFDAKDYNVAYAMSKAALMQMVRAFACEYAAPKIIGLCPHSIANTQMTQQAAEGLAEVNDLSVHAVLESFNDESMTGKMINADELARLILNLDTAGDWQSGGVIEVTPEWWAKEKVV